MSNISVTFWFVCRLQWGVAEASDIRGSFPDSQVKNDSEEPQILAPPVWNCSFSAPEGTVTAVIWPWTLRGETPGWSGAACRFMTRSSSPLPSWTTSDPSTASQVRAELHSEVQSVALRAHLSPPVRYPDLSGWMRPGGLVTVPGGERPHHASRPGGKR